MAGTGGGFKQTLVGALLALAIGAGPLFLSHVNDAGFWQKSKAPFVVPAFAGGRCGAGPKQRVRR
ncbi:hypothetical protein ACQCSU_05710 [Pseudarthrobacter sp. O4]|uniref:GntT/GntP/DsdX family permease n=1 Tax=Pseudarthrobacter sp. O4 TaxID=3418417 RepID=UPI003CF7F25F